MDGGFLPYGRQSITEADIAEVAGVLRSAFLTGGPAVEEFERRFAERVGAKHAVAVNSATSALHLAMRVAGLGPGDRVVTSPITFVASANCAAFVGATPDFADIEPVGYTLDPGALASTWAPDTRAVVAVDYAGQACDFPAVAAVARERGAIVIEDACHAVGGEFHHQGGVWKVGGHPWADMTVFSFHPVKTMTTGEGGMLVTDNEQWASLARRLRSHGVVRDRDRFCGLTEPDEGVPAAVLAERGDWYYEMHDLGYNYRLTDLQSALGLSQLQRLDEFTHRRRQIVARYNAAFADLPTVRRPALRNPVDASVTSWHLYTLQIDFPAVGRTRSQVMAALRDSGIGSQVLYIPVHLQPWYRRQYGYARGKCPVAEGFYAGALSIPLYPEMSDSDVTRVIDVVSTVVRPS